MYTNRDAAATPAPSPLIDHVVPAPVVTHAAPAPVFEYLAGAYITPAPAMIYAVPIQQLLPAYTMTTVTTDDNFDLPGLVNPQFSITAVEASAPQTVGSLHHPTSGCRYADFSTNRCLSGRFYATLIQRVLGFTFYA